MAISQQCGFGIVPAQKTRCLHSHWSEPEREQPGGHAARTTGTHFASTTTTFGSNCCSTDTRAASSCDVKSGTSRRPAARRGPFSQRPANSFAGRGGGWEGLDQKKLLRFKTPQKLRFKTQGDSTSTQTLRDPRWAGVPTF